MEQSFVLDELEILLDATVNIHSKENNFNNKISNGFDKATFKRQSMTESSMLAMGHHTKILTYLLYDHKRKIL